jgi:salicylate hydroxylase
MLPYLAQGANSSLEDGAVLGLLLGHMTNKTQLPRILRLYESMRKSRGESIVKETFKQVLDMSPLYWEARNADSTIETRLPHGEWPRARETRSGLPVAVG